MSFADRLYRHVLLPPIKALTRDDAETAHNWFVSSMEWASRHPKVLPGQPISDPKLAQTLLDGLMFPNPFGTAAGMDKNGTLYPALIKLTGVGHVELGGATMVAQVGNARPRIVRVDGSHLINAMGFPNKGVDALVKQIANTPTPPIPLSVQIAKNKDTSDDDAPAEYGDLIRKFAGMTLPNYFTINVSSPNTPGLRALQAPEFMELILEQATAALDEQGRSRRRLLVKLAPDIEEQTIVDVIELVLKFDIGGVVLTNSTTTRPVSSKYDERPGGFSGSALYERSSGLVKFAAQHLPADRVLVAVGGIDSAERAYEMLHYADLVDGYTALVLKSPFTFRTIAKQVLSLMDADGVKTLADLRSGNRPATAVKAAPKAAKRK